MPIARWIAAHPHEKSEGAFYIWSAEEIRELVPNAADEFCRRYGVLEGGNVENDPHGGSPAEILYEAEVADARSGRARRILLAARGMRPRPHLDDKILTAWNGLMISAFALAGRRIGRAALCRSGAPRGLNSVIERMYSGGVLLRRYRAGRTLPSPAFSTTIRCSRKRCLDLYETQFDRRHLDLAIGDYRQNARAVRRRRQGRILQLRRGRPQPGDAHERRLRRRRASRQFHRRP